MLKKLDSVSGYRDDLEISTCGQRNLTPGADPDSGKIPEFVNDDDDRYFDGAVGAESAHRILVKRMALDLKNESRAIK